MTSPLTIRPATADDHPGAQALAGELLAGMAPWRPPTGQRAAVEAWVREACAGADGQQLLVAGQSGGPLLGFAAVGTRGHFAGGRDGYLAALVVAPHARRRGVAVALVRAAQDWAAERGLDRITLETGAANAAARALYARLGYVEEEVTLTRSLPRT